MIVGKKEISWNYLGQGINYLLSFIVMFITIKYLSYEEIGLWYTFLNITSFVALFDFGFSQTITRNITFAWLGAKSLNKDGLPIDIIESSKPNYELLSKLNYLSKSIFLFITIVILFLLTTLGTLYVKTILRNLAENKYYFSWFIYCGAALLNTYFIYFISFFNGVGAIIKYNRAFIISRMAQIVLLIVLILLNTGIFALTFSTLVCSIISYLFFVKYFREYNIKIERINIFCIKKEIEKTLDLFKIIWYSSWRSGLYKISLFLILYANTFLSSLYLGLKTTGIYGISLQIINVVSLFSIVSVTTFTPRFTSARLKKDIALLKMDFSTTVFIYIFIYWIGIIGIIFVGFPILKIIKPNLELRISFFLFMSICIFFEYFYRVCLEFIITSNRFPFLRSGMISSIAIVVFSFILLKFTSLGIWGLLISQLLIQSLYNYWKWPRYVLKELNLKIGELFVIGASNIYEFLVNNYLNKFKRIQ